jgi:hypothetical protein
MFLLLLSLTSTPALAKDPAAEAAPFHPGEVQRFRSDARVRLPGAMWLVSERNDEARVAQFAVGLVVACGAIEDGKRAWQVDCTVEDAAIQGVPMPGDEAGLEPVLAELDDQLTGKLVRLRVKRDGRVTAVELVPDGSGVNRRTRLRDESLRLIVARGLAGLDLLRPPRSIVVGDLWLQSQSLLTMAPTVVGTAGATELVHQLKPREEGGYTVLSSGKAMISPTPSADGGENHFATTLNCRAEVDARGHLVSRVWEVIGKPTASSDIADGTAGLEYVQQGTLRALGADEATTLGMTGVVEAWGPLPTALHGATSFGPPRPPL